MIYAVSLNPCLDKTASLPRFVFDAPNRIDVTRLDIGGKGVNVARVLCALEAPVCLLGFDYEGGPIRVFLTQEHIPGKLLPLSGKLRTNMKLEETETGRMIEINEKGAPVSKDMLEKMEDLILSLCRPGDLFALCGSLPPGAPADTYQRLCRALKTKGGFVAVDCDGPAFLAALEEGPDLIKPNAQEFEALTHVPAHDLPRALEACRELMEKGVGSICLSRGGDGALLICAQGAFRCPALPVPVKGLQGAGDSMLAGMLAARGRHMPPREALVFASAAAAASVMRPGTLLAQKEDFLSLLSAAPEAVRL